MLNLRECTSSLVLIDVSVERQVGAGLPVIAALTRVVASGDPVHRVVGAFSGMTVLV